MPLAPAHPAAVLPLQRLGLPLSALTAGAVAPDVPVYLPAPVAYSTTHSGAGLAVDALIGLLVLGAWDFLLRDAVVDLVGFVRERSPARARLAPRGWLLAPLGVAIGAATHVLWDSVTHDWGFVVDAFPVLREQHGPLPWYGWLQHLSTAVGAAVVVAYGVHRLQRRPRSPRPAAVRRPSLWVAVVPFTALVVGVAARDVNTAVGAGVLAGLAVAVVWHITRLGAAS